MTESWRMDDTICAIASAPGGAARGIVRASGPAVARCVEGMFFATSGESLASVTRPTALPGELRLSAFAATAPTALYYWPTERSYTRRPQIELHTIGSPPLLEAVCEDLCRRGARRARPGEFTLRAFLAGRLDLTQAEAVLGAIDARDRNELDVALSQLAGGLSRPLTTLREELLELLAHLEAGLDFVDEDIEFISADQLQRQVEAARRQVAELLQRMTGREDAAARYRVVLYGWPNVGKSSLFNALLRGARAIVSERAGTTRDYLAGEAEFGGAPCILLDTAGAAETDDPADAAAQILASREFGQADLRLLCLDSGRTPNAWELRRLAESDPKRLVVWTKSDLPKAPPPAPSALSVSSATGDGLAELEAQIGQQLGASAAIHSQTVGATAGRCRQALRLAEESLSRAAKLARADAGEELVASELRLALEQLGEVVGAVYTDDILDRVFSRFCIGK